MNEIKATLFRIRTVKIYLYTPKGNDELLKESKKIEMTKYVSNIFFFK